MTSDNDASELAPKAAFLTDDPPTILRYARKAFCNGIPVALVTLVEIIGGAARPIGCQMTVRMDGLYCGFVSGGCTEAAVAAEAVEALRTGHDRFLRLGEGSPFFDIVLPCGGGIRLAIHILREVGAIDRVLSDLSVRRSTGLSYNPCTESIAVQRSTHTGWDGDMFLVTYQPAVQVWLSGHALEVKATHRVAQAAGYAVRVLQGRGQIDRTRLGLDSNSAVALLCHNLESELPLLKIALGSTAFYIGALGSHRTHERRCTALTKLGYADHDIARIKAPIGIFHKARDASSIGLSVIADISYARLCTTESP